MGLRQLKTVAALAAICFCNAAIAADVIFDPTSKVAKILAIERITDKLKECDQKSVSGSIEKVEGKYPELTVWVKGRQVREAFQLFLDEFDMVTVRSLDTILAVGTKVVVDIQYCGSGGIPYPIAIKLDQGSVAFSQTSPPPRAFASLSEAALSKRCFYRLDMVARITFELWQATKSQRYLDNLTSLLMASEVWRGKFADVSVEEMKLAMDQVSKVSSEEADIQIAYCKTVARKHFDLLTPVQQGALSDRAAERVASFVRKELQ